MSGGPSEPGEDRREALRVSREPLEVKVLGTRTANGRALDVSTSGMLLEVDQPPPRVGSEVQLKLRLPGAKTRMTPTAVVVRHSGPREFAVRFLRLSNDELEALQQYVELEGAARSSG